MAEFPIAVLVSGRGSNLRALLEAEAAGRLGGAHVAVVTTNRPDCEAAALARQAGRLVLAYERKDFTRRRHFDDALIGMTLHWQPRLLVCAGFMHILGPAAVRLAQGRIINIHPSLLPRHPGLHTHERALGAGDTEHGATVHQVVPTVDAGPVIAQARVPVLPGDDAASLGARVLACEHPLLVAVVRAFAEGELTADPTGVAWRGNPLHAALSLDDLGRGLESI